MASPIPADQRWFWTETWQAGEREATTQIAAGGLPVYDDIAALFTDIDTSGPAAHPAPPKENDMTRQSDDRPLRRGDRVTSTQWEDHHGRVTNVDDKGVLVRWDGIAFEYELAHDKVVRSK